MSQVKQEIKSITYSEYKERFDTLMREVPYCYGSNASCAYDLAKKLVDEGYDKLIVDEHIESHRRSNGRLWNYTGD